MEKYFKAYERYLAGEVSQTIINSEHTLQEIYVTVSVQKGERIIGVIARNVNTEELFFITKNDLDTKIEGEGYIPEPYMGKNIKLTRCAMRYGDSIGFPYTTMLIEVD